MITFKHSFIYVTFVSTVRENFPEKIEAHLYFKLQIGVQAFIRSSQTVGTMKLEKNLRVNGGYTRKFQVFSTILPPEIMEKRDATKMYYVRQNV